MVARAELSRVLDGLYARVPLGMRLGLGPMAEACARAGHPERAFQCVHVAGTNGKGSVSVLIASAAKAAGIRTGLYTSPHLARFAERIAIDGEPLTDDAFVEVLDEALTVGHDLSFFETATFAAFLAFRRAKIELAVLEVGLGGRLDATNVIPPPRLSVITRIALDHEDRLGNTIAEIAGEKAGIVKAGAPLLVGPLVPEAEATIVRIAREAGVEVHRVVDAPEATRAVASLPTLPGSYQRDNAAIAWLACRILGIEAHAARGFAAARWPGRFEWLATAEGLVLLDAAHNPDGAEALVRAIADDEREPVTEASATASRPTFCARPRALVFGSLADKNYAKTLPILAAPFSAEARFYTEPRGRLPASPSVLAGVAAGVPCASLTEALGRARAHVGRDGVVVISGSLYLVGEARSRLLGLQEDPPVAL